MKRLIDSFNANRHDFAKYLRKSAKEVLKGADNQDTVPAMFGIGLLSVLLDGAAWTLESGPEKLDGGIKDLGHKASTLKNTFDTVKLIRPINLHNELVGFVAASQRSNRFEARLVESDERLAHRSWSLTFPDNTQILVDISNPDDGMRLSLHIGEKAPTQENNGESFDQDSLFKDQSYTTYTILTDRTGGPIPFYTSAQVTKTPHINGNYGVIERLDPATWRNDLASVLPVEIKSQLSVFK